MKFLSVCSGIEAASVAWEPLGWSPLAFSEIEKFPSAVLAHHWPDVPNLGDLTRNHEFPISLAPDLIIGGTPCQSFSVAGLRKGLADDRGKLALEFVKLVSRYRPRWVVWENVPGVLSSSGGSDLAEFLGALAGRKVRPPVEGWKNSGVIPGIPDAYGLAWRVLDAQNFGVPQRRRRVFLVAHLGNWKPAAAVLFEPESLRGDPPPRRETGQGVAPTISARTRRGGGLGTDFEVDGGLIPEVCPAVTTGGGKPGQGVPMVFGIEGGETGHCLRSEPSRADKPTSTTYAIQERAGVRRLTPRECERLQGFPDDYTRIPWRGKKPENCPDGPRYKALGNSMAVPVIRWIGRRLDLVNSYLPKR